MANWWDHCEWCGSKSFGEVMKYDGPVVIHVMERSMVLCRTCMDDAFTMDRLDRLVNG